MKRITDKDVAGVIIRIFLGQEGIKNSPLPNPKGLFVAMLPSSEVPAVLELLSLEQKLNNIILEICD